MKKTQLHIGKLPSKMKSLFPILGLTFLSLTLTNCSLSLSPEKIASRLEPSVVLLSYKNQPGHGTGFFVDGEPGVCRVLTAAHVVNKEAKIRLRTEKDGKLWDVARVEIFPNTIDLALVTFQPDTERCNYPALTIGNSESLRKGSSIFIYGFLSRGGKLIGQFVNGQVSALNKLARGYGVSYRTLTVGGMSGAPVIDERGKVVAVHGMSDREIVQSLASQKLGLSESERQLSQEAEESLRTTSIEPFTFSWGVPIAFFRESQFYSPDANISGWGLWILFSSGMIFGGGIVYFGLRHFQTPQISTQRERELERQLEWEKRKIQEVEAQLQRQGQVQPPVIEPQSSGDVPLVSAVGVNYTKLRDLLAAKKWKEADYETYQRMLEGTGKSEGYLDVKDIENFPCQDLGTIDKLWVKYSNGNFGFSVQKQIYQSLGGTKEYDQKVWKAFGDKVGWRQGGSWLNYSNMTFSDKHYTGHLPGIGGGYWGGLSSITQRLVYCNI